MRKVCLHSVSQASSCLVRSCVARIVYERNACRVQKKLHIYVDITFLCRFIKTMDADDSDPIHDDWSANRRLLGLFNQHTSHL